MSSPQSPECDHRSTEKGVQAYIQDWVRILYDATGDQTKVNRAIELADLNGLFDPVRFAASPPAHQENSPRSAPESAPAQRASHNSGERLPSSDAADAGADTEPAPQVREALERAHDLIGEMANRLFPIDPYTRDGRTPEDRDNLRVVSEIRRDINRILALTPVVAREPVGWRWPRALNVTRSVHNHWHGDISFARSPTDKELRNLDEFLNAHHINASPPPASAVREAFPPSPDVEYVASRGQSKVSYWVTREEGDDIRARALSIKGTDLKQADETSEKSR